MHRKVTRGRMVMSKLTDNQQKHLEYLLADIGSVKAEIARRSNLQRVVLATYIAVIAVVGKEAASHALSAPLLVGLWVSGALALQFYTREGLEIRRLGAIVRERIVPIARKILKVQKQDVFPSETNSKFPEEDRITSRYNRQFKWTLFLVLPLAITVFYLSQDWSRIPKIVDLCSRGPYIATSALLAGLWTLWLLKTHAWSVKETNA
jgi:hypothetical protein